MFLDVDPFVKFLIALSNFSAALSAAAAAAIAALSAAATTVVLYDAGKVP